MIRLNAIATGVGVMFGASMAGASGVGEEGSGTLITERLALSGFTGIEVAGSWPVTVRPGPYDVQVTVDDNVIDDLRVEVRGDALHFRLRPQVRLRRVTLRAQVTITGARRRRGERQRRRDVRGLRECGAAAQRDGLRRRGGLGDLRGQPWLRRCPVPATSR